MYHTGNWGASAVFYVGGGTRDSARSRDSAENSRADIAQTLRDKLGVGIVLIVYHAV